MTDILDKAILIGMAVEKRLKEFASELIKEAKEEGVAESKLPPRKEVENRVVEEGVKILRELVSAARSGKEVIDKHIHDAVEEMLERFKVATREDLDVIEKMARVAREKVDKLEERILDLEARIQKPEARS